MRIGRGEQAPEDDGLARYFLTAGEVHCASLPSIVTTVLGSCVAVCVRDKGCRLGGMNHYMLPRGTTNSTRFGDVAIDRLIEGMLALGCRTERLEAKVFGGAATFAADSAGRTVGSQNVALAMQRLQDLGIPLLARRCGGTHGMLLHFYTHTGVVLVRRLGSR